MGTRAQAPPPPARGGKVAVAVGFSSSAPISGVAGGVVLWVGPVEASPKFCHPSLDCSKSFFCTVRCRPLARGEGVHRAMLHLFVAEEKLYIAHVFIGRNFF